MNLYKKSTGKYYYDDNATILLWIRKDEKKKKEELHKYSNYKGREYPEGFFDDGSWYANLQDNIENEYEELYEN